MMVWKLLGLIATAMLFSCCALSPTATEAAARESLNLLTDTVGPASKLASASCEAKKRLVPAEIKAGAYSTAVGDQKLADIRARCTSIEDTINVIRSLHDEAAKAVETGSMNEALQRLRQAGEQFRGLQPQLEEP